MLSSSTPRAVKVTFLAFIFLAGCTVMAFSSVAESNPNTVSLTPEGYFEGPGFDFLVYHNRYIGGRQGGLQMLLNGIRVLDSGTLFYRTRDGKQIGYYSEEPKKTGKRQVDPATKTVTLPVQTPGNQLDHDLVVHWNGKAITITARLKKPVDWSRIAQCVLKIEIYPEAYVNTSYMGGSTRDYFRERTMSRHILIPKADRIMVAAEDLHKKLVFTANNAVLSMRDERRDLKVAGFMVFASLPEGSTATSFSLTITPSLDPDWRARPVLQFSQAGYHPAQRKMAVLQTDARLPENDVLPITLLRLSDKGDMQPIITQKPARWGPLFQYMYYTFDFSKITRPGLYYLRYGDIQEGPFPIAENVYDTAWHPSMDTFFPVQMCHVKVRDYLVVWHGACHVDDAMQAPPNQQVIDGYHEGPETETTYPPNTHVPGLDWGGWHDAGDFDLPTGSAAMTLLWMELALEQFHVDRDVTTVNRAERLVELHQPDGKNDMAQQVAFGMACLLGHYRAFGHIGAGIIANKGPDYGRIGDPCSITDGLVYDKSLAPEERKNGRSGRFDDRWVFTNRNTGGQYQFVQVAALASRVLQKTFPDLAAESLDAAKTVWEYEQTHSPVNFQVAYQPQEDQYHSWEIAAAVELLLATGDSRYREAILKHMDAWATMPPEQFGHGNGFELLRVYDKIKDENFRALVRKKAEAYASVIHDQEKKSPFQVSMSFGIWGNDWTVLKETARLYFFVRLFPDLFSPESVYHGVTYTLGCHPATNHSYVSGVGTRSATVAFGFNRNDGTYIPGGVISGASLIRPRFIEYRGRPWDWYQTEYVISGTAAYVFDVLAVRALLGEQTPPR